MRTTEEETSLFGMKNFWKTSTGYVLKLFVGKMSQYETSAGRKLAARQQWFLMKRFCETGGKKELLVDIATIAVDISEIVM